MPAIISGTVFNDINRNATFISGNPGISSVFITLQFPDNSCQQTQSATSGSYSFTGLTQVGTYRILETVITANGCPPSTFIQPTGYTQSTTPRVIAFIISQTDINTNRTFANNNFGHLNSPPLDCPTEGLQFSQVPTITSTINLVTGKVTNLGAISPNNLYNAFGYSVLNNTIYGFNNDQARLISLTFPTTGNLLAPVAGLSPPNYVVADVDMNGHYYMYANTATTYRVIDVNPNSATYLKNVDPQNSFQEDPTAAGFPISALTINDWAFNPVDGNLYALNNTDARVVRMNPITMTQTFLSTTGTPTGDHGACFFDSAGNFYVIQNSDGGVVRFVLTSTSATGTRFSTAVASFNIDGTRCPLAAVNLLQVIKGVNKTTALLGDIITYTIDVKNVSNITVTNVIITDPIPSGTTLIGTSVTVNGSSVTANPANGINVGTILSGGTTTLQFQVRVGATLPTPNPVPNTANVAYDTGTPISSNTVTTLIINGYRGISFLNNE